MNHWLMKSEPNDFSIDDLRTAPGRETHWGWCTQLSGTKLHAGPNEAGRSRFFYHSNCAEPGITGIAKISREAYPDHTAFNLKDKHYDPKSDPDNPRWHMVNISYQRKLNRMIPLSKLREYSDRQLKNLTLLRRGNRLSITPVNAKEWFFILSLE